jgi:tetratricopeptide (TPR) repeat protein
MKNTLKKKLFACILLVLPLAIHAQVLPDSFIVFRDTVYLQNRSLPETTRLYTAARQDIENMFTGASLYLALARCEYLMGISFRVENRSSEAAACFERGIAWAEKSINICPSSEGYRLLGTNISFLCEVRISYGLGNYRRIETNAKKALELDPNNLSAQYLIAAQYVAAPWPLGNVQRGTALLEEITRQNYLSMDKEDLFNLYMMFETAFLKQGKNEEAQIWHQRAAALYPTNNFISVLVK